MPLFDSNSSTSFFTLPFRRKKQRYIINPPDETFSVIYLGNVLTVLAKGEGCLEKPLSLIWKAYTSRQRNDLNMQLEVKRSGLKAETKTQGLTEYWAHRITFCAAPSEYPRLFCWVYKHDGKRLRPELRCHAVLCKKSADAVLIQESLSKFLHEALQEYRREKLSQQKARAFSMTGCPRRKLLLQTGSLHFRPPVSRSKSAPRLGSIHEEHEEEEYSDVDSMCYREEPIGDSASTSSSTYAASDATSPSSTSSSLQPSTELRGKPPTEPDTVSDESGYHEEKRSEHLPYSLNEVENAFFSDEELILMEEELDDTHITPL